MAVAEALIALSATVAKSTLKLWLKDHPIAADLSEASTDLVLGKVFPGVMEKRRAQAQFDRIGDLVADRLERYYINEFGGLEENEKQAAIYAVRDTLERTDLTSELLLEARLDPAVLERRLRAGYPNATRDLKDAGKDLYRRALSETCVAITEAAMTRKGFQADVSVETLRQIDRFVQMFEEMLERLPSPTPGDEFETKYRRHIVLRLEDVELFGLDVVSPHSRRYKLSEASMSYVTLRVGWQPGSGAAGAVEPRGIEQRVEQLLARHRRVLIRGDAGTGKTTLLQWLAVLGAQRQLPAELERWNPTVPFFLRLRDYAADGRMPTPESFLDQIAEILVGEMPNDWVRQHLRSGRAVVLIDGLDELAPTLPDQVFRWLEELLQHFPNARYVMTSRLVDIDDAWLDQHGFLRAHLPPMTPTAIEAFVDYWHMAIGANLDDDDARESLLKLGARFRALLRDNGRIRSLASFPLLCAILCALHRELTFSLPERRMELYQVALRSLLHRDTYRRRIPWRLPNFSPTEAQYLLQHLAWWMLRNNKAQVSREDVIRQFTDRLLMMPRVTSTAEEILGLLVWRSGVLRELDPDTLDFLHPTFQEYLAAAQAVDANDIGELVSNAEKIPWREVVVLAAGHSHEHQLNDLIGGLLKRADAEPGERQALQLLAVACLDTAVQMPYELQRKLETCVKKLVPPRTMADAATLASGARFAIQPLVRYRLENPNAPAPVVAACVRAITLAGTRQDLAEEALGALERFADDNRVAVVRELVRAWSSGIFDPDQFAQKVMQSSSLEQGALQLTDPGPLASTRYLRFLDQVHCKFGGKVQDLVAVRGVGKIVTMDLTGSRVSDLGPLRELGTADSLTWLSLARCNRIADLGPLAALVGLEVLHLSECGRLADLSPLLTLRRLTGLFLHGCVLADLESLAKLHGLRTLDLSETTGPTDLSVVVGMGQLEQLKLSACEWVTDLSPLARLSELSGLFLDGCPNVHDLEPLRALPRLKRLDITGCTGISDVSIAAQIPGLEVLGLPGQDQDQMVELEGGTQPSVVAEDLLADRQVPPLLPEQVRRFALQPLGARSTRSFDPKAILSALRASAETNVVAVDMGGDKLTMADYGVRNGLLVQTTAALVQRGDGGSRYVEVLEELADRARRETLPVGISFAGPTDGTRLLGGPNLPILIDELDDRYGGDFANLFPVVTVANDAEAGIMASALEAAKRYPEMRNVVYVINGSGLGGAVLTKGTIFAAEPGHIPIEARLNPFNQRKACGTLGATYVCLEAVAASKAGIEDIWFQRKGERRSGREIAAMYLVADQLALDLYDNSALVTAHAIKGMAQAFELLGDLDRTIVVGHGGIFHVPGYGERVCRILEQDLSHAPRMLFTRDFSANTCLDGAAVAAMTSTYAGTAG